MNENISDLLRRITQVLQRNALREELDEIYKEILQFQQSPAYFDRAKTTPRDQDDLMDLKGQVEERLDGAPGRVEGQPHFENEMPGQEPPQQEPMNRDVPLRHPEEALRLFKQAQDAFIAGDFDLAENRALEALAVDPNYQSAKNLLKTLADFRSGGSIPRQIQQPLARAENALVGIDSRLAQKEYTIAKQSVENARASLNEAAALHFRLTGDAQWAKAAELDQKIHNYLQSIELAEGADRNFEAARKLFNDGELEQAIELAKSANTAFKRGDWVDIIAAWTQFKDDLDEIDSILAKENGASAEEFASAYETVTRYQANRIFKGNPLVRIRTEKLQDQRPKRREELLGKQRDGKDGAIRRAITQAARARSIISAQESITQAANLLECLKRIGGDADTTPPAKGIRQQPSFGRNPNRSVTDDLQADIDRVRSEIDTLCDELSAVEEMVAREAYGQIEEAGKHVFKRFPQDPRVIAARHEAKEEVGKKRADERVKQAEESRERTMLWLKVIGVLAAILILGYLAVTGAQVLIAFVNRPAPTALPTAVMAATPSPVPPTAAPTLTPPPTRTPPPQTGYIRRNIWTRNGCYDTYKATGWVLAGTQFVVVKEEERTDDNGNPCLLIETTDSEGKGVTGWAKKSDLEISR